MLALAVALVIVLSFLLLRRNVTTPWLVLTGTVLVAFSAPLVGLSTVVLTEVPFMAMTLAFLLVFDLAYREEGRIDLVLWSGVLAGSAFLLRYAASAIVAFGVAMLVWQALRAGARSWRRPLWFLAAALPLPAIWVAHNYLHGEGPLGERFPAVRGLVDNAVAAVLGLRSWLVPPARVAGVLVLMIGVLAAIWLSLHPTEPGRAERAGLTLLALFAVGYAAFVVVGASITKVDAPNERLMGPVFVPVLVILLAVAQRGLAMIRDRSAVVWVGALIAFFAVPAYAITPWPGVLEDRAENGFGFTQPAWEQSALVAVAASLDSGELLYSNSADGVYYVTGRQPVRFGPTDNPGELAEFTTEVFCLGPVWYAHFEAGHYRPGILAPEELGPSVTSELVEEVSDGGLYRVAAVPPAEPADCALQSSAAVSGR